MLTAKPEPSLWRAMRSYLLWIVLSVLLLGLVYPRIDLWWLSFFALMPMALCAKRGRNARALYISGYLAWLAWWLVMLNWLSYVTVPGYIAVCFYLALFGLALIWGIRIGGRYLRLPLFIILPVMVVAWEWVRSWLLSGFPWFQLGHPQPVIMCQIADWGGVYAVSFVVAMTNGLLGDLLTYPLRPPPRREDMDAMTQAVQKLRGRVVPLALTFWVLAMSFTLIYGYWRLAETDDLQSTAATLPIAVIQTDTPQTVKMESGPEAMTRRFEAAIRLMQQATERDPQIIVWPETSCPVPLNAEAVDYIRSIAPDGVGYAYFHDYLTRWAAQSQTHLIVGAHAYGDDAQPMESFDQAKRYNAAYWITPDEGVTARYDKIHPVPFGEYLPNWLGLRGLFLMFSPYEQDNSLTAGSEYVRFEYTDARGMTWRLAAPICFEDVISYVPRNMVFGPEGKQVDVLINLTNDGWYPDTAQPWQHEQIARFRCIENRVPMARSVNRGVSGFIDSAGRIVEVVRTDGQRQSVEGVARYAVHHDPRGTLFNRVGELFAWIVTGFAAMIIIIGLWVARRVRRMIAEPTAHQPGA